MTRIVLLGPPGAGKGTQAARLAEALGVPAISTGDIFRANIAGGTDLGRLAQEYTDRGELVPDSVTNEMVAARLDTEDARAGFLLDGYPRNVAQVAELDSMLAARDVDLDVALELVVDETVVVERLLHRATVEGRADDTADVVRRRLSVYTEQTAPIAGVYEARGSLRRVEGAGDVAEVTDRLLAAVRDAR